MPNIRGAMHRRCSFKKILLYCLYLLDWLDAAPFMSKYPRRAYLRKARWTAFLFSMVLIFGSLNYGLAQINDCDNTLMNETDTLTGESIIRSQRNIIISDDEGKTGFAISAFLMDSTFIIIIKTVGASACINYGDQIHFVFNDSSTLQLNNMGQFNCEAKSSLYFNARNNNFHALQTLLEKRISKLTVWTKKRFLSKYLTTEAAEKIHILLACFNRTLGDDTFVRRVNNSVFVIVENQPEFRGGYDYTSHPFRYVLPTN